MAQLTQEYIEANGFKQLGRRNMWSNRRIMLEPNADKTRWFVFVKDSNNVTYSNPSMAHWTEKEEFDEYLHCFSVRNLDDYLK